MVRIFNKVPADRTDWKDCVTAANLQGRTINTFTGMKSASKITQEQFLLLKVVWPDRKNALQFNPATYGLRQQFTDACRVLAGFPNFQSFLRSIQTDSAVTKLQLNDPMDLGVFELVRQGQRDIDSYTESNVPQIAPGLQVNLSIPRKLDEEVVNMGLVLLLNALAIKTPNVTTTCFSERAAISARFMQDRYEARTDGVLLHRDRTVQAILEVKPRPRDKLRPHIQMEESAEMVAWIVNDHRPLAPNLKGRHLLIAQDEDEIYLAFARYNQSYLNYLRHDIQKPAAFLTIQEYGPWNIQDAAEVEHLSQILVAFLLRANDGH
ncbi:hypothetical protein V8E54_006878 [Elaphomyces granulatus]